MVLSYDTSMLHNARLSISRLRLLSLLTSVAVGTLTCVPSGVVAEAASTRKIYFYHSDHFGSTTLVTDEQGQVVERVEYTPFGSVSVRDGPATVPHQFTGQRHDATTGFSFYGARYYDPTLGRFIQPDALVPDPTNPQALNRYSYVQNNPVTFVDPSGHKRRGFFRAFFAAIAAVVTTVVTGGQGELAIFVYSAIAGTAGAVLGDQVGQAVDRSATTTSPVASQAALLATALPTSTTPRPPPRCCPGAIPGRLRTGFPLATSSPAPRSCPPAIRLPTPSPAVPSSTPHYPRTPNRCTMPSIHQRHRNRRRISRKKAICLRAAINHSSPKSKREVGFLKINKGVLLIGKVIDGSGIQSSVNGMSSIEIAVIRMCRQMVR